MLVHPSARALGAVLRLAPTQVALSRIALAAPIPPTTVPPVGVTAWGQFSAGLARSFKVMAVELAPEKSFNPAVGDKRKMAVTVGTHNGTFHCDEALACFMLHQTSRFQGAEIVRTRDQKELETLDAVVDVGGVYDPDTCRFDHHQRGFEHVFGHGFSTKLSSAGLVYKHFGREIVGKQMGLPESHADVEKVYLRVYKTFMEAIDGIDNGVNQYDSSAPPRYLSSTHLSARVGHLNPEWTEPYTREKETAGFQRAMELAGGEFLESVRHVAKSWLPARAIVEEVLLSRKDVDASGEILRLTQYCPWKEHLSELEEELGVEPLPKYILYQDDSSGTWRVQAIAVAPGRFESRKPLPASWRGLRDDELSEHSGIPGGVFVHGAGFIGGNKTYEGALEMARKSLQME